MEELTEIDEDFVQFFKDNEHITAEKVKEPGTNKSLEDRKLASQAVAFVIKHSRKGIVSLCASVAGLLEERERIKSENKTLFDLLNQTTELKNGVESLSRTLSSQLSCPEMVTEAEVHPQPMLSPPPPKVPPHGVNSEPRLRRRKTPPPPPPRTYKPTGSRVVSPTISLSNLPSAPSPLHGCLCHQCQVPPATTRYRVTDDRGRALLSLGQPLVLAGLLTGILQYLGHLDDCSHPALWAGVTLDLPVGDHDGTYQGQRYFICPKKHGVFVPLTSILALQN